MYNVLYVPVLIFEGVYIPIGLYPPVATLLRLSSRTATERLDKAGLCMGVK